MSSKIVLMTGCSSGIGLATAKRLAHDPDQRFVVIATVIALSEKDDLVAAVGDTLDKTVFIRKLDLTVDQDITDVVDDVIKTHGRVDILINSAGISLHGIPESFSRQQIEQVFNVNTIGPIRLTQAVLPGMKKMRAGKIIIVTSVLGRIGWAYSGIYCASKFALEGFFESLAAAARSFNIRVCTIQPGSVETPLFRFALEAFGSLAVDESIEDIDRRHTSYISTSLNEAEHASPSDVAEEIVTRCIEVDEPVFRHLLSEEHRGSVEQAVKDLTGESAVEGGRKMIGVS